MAAANTTMAVASSSSDVDNVASYNDINDASFVAVIGKRRLGKSTLVKDLISQADGSIVIFAPKEDEELYGRPVNPLEEKDLITTLKNGNRDVIVWDGPPLRMRETYLNTINLRHIGKKLIVTTQYPKGMSPALRSNVDKLYVPHDMGQDEVAELYQDNIPTLTYGKTTN